MNIRLIDEMQENQDQGGRTRQLCWMSEQMIRLIEEINQSG